MPLREEMEKQGRWLFRWRSFLPLLAAPLLVPAFEHFSYPLGSHTGDLVWEMFCLTVSLTGQAIRAYTTGCTPRGTSGRNTKSQVADELNTGGMYSVVRHPLYLGNFFMALGPALFLRIWWVVLFYALCFWIYYERIVFAEEEFLRSKFGEAYLEWASRIPAFVPRRRDWQPPELAFSWRTALKKEYHSLFALIGVLTGMEVIADSLLEKSVHLDLVWILFFSGGLLFYIVVRVLQKKTRLLQVQGR